MKRRAGILARGMILTFLLTLLLGSFVVHAEDGENGVSINYTKYTLNLGDEDDVLQLKIENLKEGDRNPRWISYNVNVATVDQDGVVTPLRKGIAVISSGIGFPRKTCVVTVVDPSVKLNKAAATLYRSANETTPGNTITLTAKVNGATKDAKDVVWKSSNEKVAKVEKDAKGRGVVTAVDGANGEAGTAVITARVNGRTATCKVTVLDSTISLNVNKMQLSTKGAGSSIKLLPTVVGSKKAVTWTSSDTKVATVSGGKVTGKTAGTATVTAKANGVEATCEVTVKDQQISISEEKVLLYVTKNASEEITGETKELKTNAANNDVVTWTSSDESVVRVEGKVKGKAAITAVGAGTATITVTREDQTDTCEVEVKNPSASIAEKVVHLKNKGTARTYTLGYQVTGRNNKVTWKSSDAKVVSVSKGKLTGKKAGTATVTMTANGVTDTVQVIVQDYTPTIALNQKEYTLYTKGGGNSIALKATVNGASKKVQWQSNNTSVAEVKNGKVVAKAKGKALITATANDVTAKCWISVKEPKIILERNALVIKPTDKVNLCDYASIEVVGAKQSVTYKSSDAKTVTVDKKGNVTGKKVGNATITVKANGVEEICDVTVSDCETHVWVDATDEKYEKFNRSATCEETGLSCKECSVCHGKEQIVTPPLGHSFGKWTVVAWSTENAAGLERQVCTRCKEENTRIIPAKNKGDLAYGYKLAWEDNFNGAELDRSSWNVELHEPGWVNAELQEYVDSEKNIYVKDGNLVIQAIKDGNNYTSGRVNTQNKHDYQYGRFEARAKVPSGQGFLPAFWMMPTDEMYYGQWPLCGEIDIMEVMGQETNKAYSTLHFGQPHTQKQGSYTLAEGETDFSENFHVYACEWDPDEFRFYVDDKLFYKVNDWFTKRQGYPETAYPAPYDQPFYMILNLAVGGSWVGYPDETTAFGDNAQLVVDYVRVYQKDEYDRNISKPGTDIQLRDPDETGNYIINGDFAKPEDLSKKEDDQENWKLHLEKGGAATAENSDEVLNITPTAAGTENHSVQIVQANLPIEKGCSYKLSYEAYADAERTMITDVSAPDRGYIRYLADTKVTLTTTLQNFEHTFEMTSDSDANGRVEFNLGNQGSTAAVHIDNVRLEKLGVVEEEEEVKGVLPDGNYVYNGAFNEGNLPGRLRLDYWDWKAAKGASVSVTDDSVRELKVVVPETVSALEDVAVYQKPIAITGGKTYKLSFDAHADQAKTIKTTIAGMTFESALTADKQKYTYELETAEGLDGSELRFLLGAPGITYIDNVSIRKVGADTGLIVNGDFSSVLEGFDPYVDSSASATYVVDSLKEKDAFSIDITDTGDAAWKIQLKQNNIKLEKDKWYKLDFDAKSTMNRKIMYALQRDGSSDDNWTPYSGEHVIDLTNEYQTFSHTFKMANDTDPKTVLSISMGAVGGTQITEKHTVVIDNIKLVETDPVEIPPVVEGKEMIANGDFSEGDAHWEKVVLETGEAEAEFTDGENGKATYKITNVGTEDWHIQLKHKEKLTLEKGAEYAVKFNIKSTEARTVKYAFMGTGDKWYGGEDLALEAGAVKEVNSTVKITEDTSNQITFQISMGQIYDHWDVNVRQPIDTPISTIEIDDISVKKIGGTGGEEPDDPIEPVAPGTELIKNGDFSNGKEDWTESGIYEEGVGTESFEDEKAAYTITNVGTADWHVQLKQTGLTLEKDAKYKLSFKIKSTAARDVMYKLQDPDNGYADYGNETISLEANTEKTVEKEITVDKASSKSIIFVVAMGKIGNESLTEHTIEIDDVSLVKLDGTGGDTPEEPVKIGTELIVNGNFAAGKGTWGDYIHTAGGAKAATAFTDGKARYEISSVGTDDWNVQLKQAGLKMEQDATYKVSLKIGASIDRDVKLVFLNANDEPCVEESISLKKDTVKSVNRVVTLNDSYTSGTLAFQLSMGKIGTISEAHAIEITDISVKKVEAGTTADAETETEVTIAPPGNTPEEPDDPEAENLIKNGDFSEGETNWESYIDTANAAAEVSFDGGKATYEITKVGTQDYHIQLKQGGLTLEKGATYNVTFDISSTAARTVKSVLQDSSYDWYGGKDDIVLTANKETKVTYEFTVSKDTCDTIDFIISMGKINEVDTPTSTIEIDNVSLVKVGGTGGEGGDEVNDDITGLELGEEMITNGDFTIDDFKNGNIGWEQWPTAEEGAEATFKIEDGKAVIDITNIGTLPYSVQLKQTGLTLEKDASYVVQFDIESNKDRDVLLELQENGGSWAVYGERTFQLKANKTVHVTAKIDVTKETTEAGLFFIGMGKVGATKNEAYTITIDNVSVKKVSTATDEGGEPATQAAKTITPIDDTDDGDAVEDDDQNTDDPSDDEDADPADQKTSDDQDDSGDAETSDGRSGSGSSDVSDASDDSSNAKISEN